MKYQRKTKDLFLIIWNGEQVDQFETYKEAKAMKMKNLIKIIAIACILMGCSSKPGTQKRLVQIMSDDNGPLLIIELDTIYQPTDIIELGGERFGYYYVTGSDTTQEEKFLAQSYIVIR